MRTQQTTQRKLVTIWLITLILMTFSFAGGSDGAKASDSYMDEVITVSARKREQSIYEIPSQLTVFSPDQMERQGIRNIVDLGKFVPNLNITTFSGGSPAGANPFIRGIGLQDHLIFTDPGVGIYVDGVYLGRQIGQNWNISNIERVEVLRGPQGTFLGRNSIGGAVNIITRKPDDQQRFADVKIEAGLRERINASFYGNVPLSQNFAVSLNTALRKRAGVGEFTNISNPEKDVGEIEDISGRLAALWFLSDNFSLLFAADGNSAQNGLNPYTTHYPEGLDTGGPDNSDVSSDPYNNNTGDREITTTQNSAYGFSLTADWQVNDEVESKLILSRRHSDYEAGLDDDSAFEKYHSFPEDGYATQESAELQVNAHFYPFDVIFGLYYFTEDGRNVQPKPIFQGNPGSLYTDQKVVSQSVYTNVGWTLSEQLRLSGGLRFTKDKKQGRAKINDIFDESGERDWKEWSWDFSASYMLNNQMTTYANIANGYQSGVFPARPYCFFNTPPCIPLTASDNINAINYEVGIRGKFSRAVLLSASVFMTHYSNLPYQKSDTSNEGFNTENVIVDQISTGLEMEGTFRLSPWFTLHANAGYIDTDPSDPGVIVPLTPSLTATISPEFTFVRKNGGEIIFRTDYSYRGEMFGGPVRKFQDVSRIESRELINFDLGYTTRTR